MDLAVTLVIRRGLRVALALHSKVGAPKRDWDAAMSVYRRLVTGIGGDGRRGRLFVITDGGTPDANQRLELDQLWSTYPVKTAVILPGLHDATKRGVMNALTGSNPSMAFFTPERVSGALSHLDLDGELPNLIGEFDELQSRVPSNLMLKLVAERAEIESAGSAAR